MKKNGRFTTDMGLQQLVLPAAAPREGGRALETMEDALRTFMGAFGGMGADSIFENFFGGADHGALEADLLAACTLGKGLASESI